MNERMEQLEAELSAMRPRSVSPGLVGELSAALRAPRGRSWSDRVLVFAMGVGALAACIILALLILEPKYVPPAAGPAIAARAARPDHTYAFARASSVWRDVVN